MASRVATIGRRCDAARLRRRIKHAGRVIGATDEQAAKITRFDWHKNRPIFPEDVTSTVYSVLGSTGQNR